MLENLPLTAKFWFGKCGFCIFPHCFFLLCCSIAERQKRGRQEILGQFLVTDFWIQHFPHYRVNYFSGNLVIFLLHDYFHSISISEHLCFLKFDGRLYPNLCLNKNRVNPDALVYNLKHQAPETLRDGWMSCWIDIRHWFRVIAFVYCWVETQFCPGFIPKFSGYFLNALFQLSRDILIEQNNSLIW